MSFVILGLRNDKVVASFGEYQKKAHAQQDLQIIEERLPELGDYIIIENKFYQNPLGQYRKNWVPVAVSIGAALLPYVDDAIALAARLGPKAAPYMRQAADIIMKTIKTGKDYLPEIIGLMTLASQALPDDSDKNKKLKEIQKFTEEIQDVSQKIDEKRGSK
jgi:hypothetical protein